MKFTFTLLFTIAIQTITKSQDGNWDVYLAQYEKGPGSITLNMDLVKIAPQIEFQFLVITGVTYSNCRDDGFPIKEEFDKLYEISDAVGQLLSSITKTKLAGTFTYQCKRLDYIYVRDTVTLRDKLTRLYTDKYKEYRYSITIRFDKDWEAYLKFLYPSDEILEYMSNEKVLNQLRAAGDKLNKSRSIDHWLYFSDSKDRESFIKYAENENFKIEGTDFRKDSELPYGLHISRLDNVDEESINNLTLKLRRKAKEFKGEYDGWESIVVKD